ncbi:MAG: prenylated flavin chaperone LpdD [Halobacteriota archaeon]
MRVDVTHLGRDLLVTLVGGDEHVGAVALGGIHKRSYASVLTVPNHRDDVIAKEAASLISKELKCSCVVIVGIHISNASEKQVSQIVEASFTLVKELIEALR